MTNDEKSKAQQATVPAAALLFQAPEFRAPAPSKTNESGEGRAKDRSGNDQENAAASRSGGGGRGNRRGGQARSDNSRQPARKAEEETQKKTEKTKESAAASGKSNKGQQAQKTKPKKEEANKASEGGKKEQPDSKGDNSQDKPSENVRRRRRNRPNSSSNDGRQRSAGDGAGDSSDDQVRGLKGSTRLEAKRMRRREGRRDGRRRKSITESEFLSRRESVDREMVVRHEHGADQIAVLEDGILVEHFVARGTTESIVGDIYMGKVQNVLPSMEAAFIDIGRGRNAVLYAGEVNWDVLGMEGKPRKIEKALSPGDNVVVQVTKDPIGHKGARLTSQVTLAGRHLVLVPGSSMLGISRKLPESERRRLKKLLQDIVPKDAGVIVRTAAEGATEEQLRDDVDRLRGQWEDILKKEKSTKKAPALLKGEPELVVRVVRDLFTEDISKLVVQGNETWKTVHEYVEDLSPELLDRLEHWTGPEDVFQVKRIRQQLSKGMDKKVWLPSGGTLVIERTEALTVVDVNTGKFVGSGGTLEETVTRNNLEAAEEIVRQLRLRDIGGIIIIDFVDMVLESNRELVLRRLVESLGRDRTRHQVTEITSLGLVQMTRKRVGEGLVEAFSTTCEACEGRGFLVHDHPVEVGSGESRRPQRRSNQRKQDNKPKKDTAEKNGKESHVGEEKVKTALSAIAAATVPTVEDEQPSRKETPQRNKATVKKKADAPKQGVATTADIKLPERKKEPAPKRVGRRRAVSQGPVDTGRIEGDSGPRETQAGKDEQAKQAVQELISAQSAQQHSETEQEKGK